MPVLSWKKRLCLFLFLIFFSICFISLPGNSSSFLKTACAYDETTGAPDSNCGCPNDPTGYSCGDTGVSGVGSDPVGTENPCGSCGGEPPPPPPNDPPCVIDPSSCIVPPPPVGRSNIVFPELDCSGGTPVITFSFSKAFSADRYKIWREQAGASPDLNINILGHFESPWFFYRDTNVVDGQSYRYYIAIYDTSRPNWDTNPSWSIHQDFYENGGNPLDDLGQPYKNTTTSGFKTASCTPSQPNPPLVIANFCNGQTPTIRLRLDTTALRTNYYQVYGQQPGLPEFLAANNLIPAYGQTYMDIDLNLANTTDYRFSLNAANNSGLTNRSIWTGYNRTLNCQPPTPFNARLVNNYCSGVNQVQIDFGFTASTNSTIYQIRMIDTSNNTLAYAQDLTPAQLAGNWTGAEYILGTTYNSVKNYNYYVVAINQNNNFYIYSNNPTYNNNAAVPVNFTTLNCLRPVAFSLSNPTVYCAGVSQSRISANFTKSANANVDTALRYNQTTAGYDINNTQSYSFFFPASTQESAAGSYTYGDTTPATLNQVYQFHAVAYNTNLATVDPNNYYIYSNVGSTGNPGASQYWTGPVTAFDCELPIVDIKVRPENNVGAYLDGPITIPSGFKADFNWTTTHASANSCAGSDTWSGAQPLTGTTLTAQLNNPPTNQIKYTLTCSNNNLPVGTPGRAQSDSATVNVLPLIAPWLQTQGGGDVHSNTNINVKGGP